jgi:cyanobactin cluster PatC/TenC/TruC protein
MNSPLEQPKNLQSVLTFDGKGDYVEIVNCPNPTESMTISLWAKSNTPTWNENGFLASKRDSFVIHPNAGGKSINFYIASNGWQVTSVDPQIDITQWHHYAGTFDGKSIRLYIDGEEVTRTDYVGTIQQDNGSMFIGWDDGMAGRYFNGQITEVRLWNYARKEQDIKGNMNQRLKGNETGLIGYWALNEGSGTIAPDKTSSGKNGIINGATWIPLTSQKTDTVQFVPTVSTKEGKISASASSSKTSTNPEKKEIKQDLMMTGLSDYGFWSQKVKEEREARKEPDPSFRRGRIWC